MNSNEFNNYTQLTRAELDNWFNHADKDGDGSLTMEELKEIISGEQPSTQELQSKFKIQLIEFEFDLDSQGEQE